MLLVETGRNSVSQQGHISGRLPGVNNKENTLALSKLKAQRELSTQDRGREAYLSDLVIFFPFLFFS